MVFIIATNLYGTSIPYFLTSLRMQEYLQHLPMQVTQPCTDSKHDQWCADHTEYPKIPPLWHGRVGHRLCINVGLSDFVNADIYLVHFLVRLRAKKNYSSK